MSVLTSAECSARRVVSPLRAWYPESTAWGYAVDLASHVLIRQATSNAFTTMRPTTSGL